MSYTKLSVDPQIGSMISRLVQERWHWLRKDPARGANNPNHWIVGGIVQMTIGQWLGRLWGCPVPQLQFDHHDNHDWKLAGLDVDIKSSYAPSLAVTGTVARHAWGLFVPDSQWQHHQHDIYIAAARATEDWQYMEHVWVLGWCTKSVVEATAPANNHPSSGRPLAEPARIVSLEAMNSPADLQFVVEHAKSKHEQLALSFA